MEQYKQAYELAPTHTIIAFDYGNLLADYGHPDEARAIFEVIEQDASKANADSGIGASELNAANAFQMEGEWDEAMAKFIEAASHFEAAAKRNEKNALQNQAVALMAAARIAFSQNKGAEAKELIDKAITLETRNVETEKDTASLPEAHNSLAQMLLLKSDIFSPTDLNSALMAINAAQDTIHNISTSDAKMNDRLQQTSGMVLRAKCLITARQNRPEDAQAFCEESLKVLESVKDAEGGKYRKEVAATFFILGLVQEDRKLFKEALTSFEAARAIWEDLADSGQTQYRVDQVKTTLYLMGAAYLTGDFARTVKYAQTAATLANTLPKGFSQFRFEVLTEASSMLSALGQTKDADELLRERSTQAVDTVTPPVTSPMQP